MKINSNFKREIIFFLCCLIHCYLIGIVFIVFKHYYNIPTWAILLFSILSYFAIEAEPLTFSTKIFKKYCNKECNGCSMWNCDYHF